MYPPDATKTSNTEPSIACQLCVVPLNTTLSYAAVSYMWGSSADTTGILLNGKPFMVRQSLLKLLKELAIRHYTGFFWVDALCIDQSSISERNHQVALMGKIYSRASEVLVWLHPKSEKMVRAVRFLKTFDPPMVDLSRPLLQDQVLEYLSWHKRIPKEVKEGILELCCHTYWNRAWIVQEYTLATVVSIWCGSETTATHNLRVFSSFDPRIHIGYHHIELTASYRAVERSWLQYSDKLWHSNALLVMSRSDAWHHTRQEFRPWLLCKYHKPSHLGCADIRDHVYALLSLVDPEGTIIPDYNKSPSRLFADLIDLQFRYDGAYIEDAVRDLQLLLDISDDDPTVSQLLANKVIRERKPGSQLTYSREAASAKNLWSTSII